MVKINKKLIISVILAALIIILLTPIINADSNVTLEVESIKVTNDKFSLKILGNNISKDTSIVGIKLDLFYDKDIFEVTGAKKLSAAGGSIDLYENYANEGRVRIGIVSIGGLSKSGELYKVDFKISNTQLLKDSAEFKLEIKEVSDKDGNNVEVNTTNGIISFEGITKETENKEKEEPLKIIINMDEKEESLENIEPSEDLDISLNDTNMSKHNIHSIIHEKKNNLDVSGEINYRIEDENIISIDEYGNIIAQNIGNTNIIATDEQGNEEIIPISIINDSMKNTEQYKEYERTKNGESLKERENQEKEDEKKFISIVHQIKDNTRIQYILIAIVIIIFSIIIIIIKKNKRVRKHEN